MTISSIKPVEKSVHKINSLIKIISEKTGLSEENAYTALRATLHIIRDSIRVEEATDLGAQLPTIIKGIYYEGYNPRGKPECMDKVILVSRVHSQLNNNPDINPELTVKRVIDSVEETVTGGEIEDVMENMPSDIKLLFTKATKRKKHEHS